MVKKLSFLVSVKAVVILQNYLTAPSIGLSIVALRSQKRNSCFTSFTRFLAKFRVINLQKVQGILPFNIAEKLCAL